MPRAQRLFPTAIDEISSVDRDANGHAAIMISKRDDQREDEQMPRIFDPETRDELTLDDLQFGDEVLGEDGQTYTYLSPEDAEALQAEFDDLNDDDNSLEDQQIDTDDRELELVGKRFGGKALVSKRAPKRPSLGQAVLGQLSKAMTDADRDEVISKALDVFETRTVAAEQRAENAERIAKRLANDAELDQYASIADSLGVPADSREMAGILQAVSGVLSKRQLDTFERVLTAAAHGAQYDEIGFNGQGQSSDVMDQVTAAATAAISKSGASITTEQAMVAMFEANPDAYDAYMDEQGF